MLQFVLALVIGFFVFESIGYFIHRVLHTKWAGSLSRAHMTHHLRVYPPAKFLSYRYLPAKELGAGNDAWRFALPAIALGALLVWALPPHLSVALVSELALVGALNSYLHDVLHVRGHWLERFRAFRRWRAVHVLHHIDMTVNFGIYTFHTDRLMRTYRRPTVRRH